MTIPVAPTLVTDIASGPLPSAATPIATTASLIARPTAERAMNTATSLTLPMSSLRLKTNLMDAR